MPKAKESQHQKEKREAAEIWLARQMYTVIAYTIAWVHTELPARLYKRLLDLLEEDIKRLKNNLNEKSDPKNSKACSECVWIEVSGVPKKRL